MFPSKLAPALLVRFVPHVSAVLETAKELLHVRMIDGLARGVLFQMTLRDIRLNRIVMHQHVIPRLVFRWSRARDLLVPLIGALKHGVHVDDYAAIVEALVVNDLPGRELGFCGAHGVHRLRASLHDTPRMARSRSCR